MQSIGLKPLFLLLSLLGALTATAQQATSEQDARQQLENLAKEITELQRSLERRRDAHAQAAQAVKSMDLEIQQNATELRGLEQAEASQQAVLAERNREREAYLRGLEARHAELERQILAAWRMGRESRIKLVLNQDSPARASRLLAYYEYLTRAQGEHIMELKQALSGLDEIRAAIDRELERLQAATADVKRVRAELESQRGQRLELQLALAEDIGNDETRLAELRQNRSDLETLLERLQDALADIPADLGDYRHPSSMKGQLPMPIQGRVLQAFGQARGAGLSWQGWLVEAAPGQEIRSVAYGRVAYSDWLRGYGLLIIIDHGEGFMSLYGNNESLLFSVGDWVPPGAVIATVASNPGTRQGAYFELRNGGHAVDPATWVKR